MSLIFRVEEFQRPVRRERQTQILYINPLQDRVIQVYQAVKEIHVLANFSVTLTHARMLGNVVFTQKPKSKWSVALLMIWIWQALLIACSNLLSLAVHVHNLTNVLLTYSVTKENVHLPF